MKVNHPPVYRAQGRWCENLFFRRSTMPRKIFPELSVRQPQCNKAFDKNVKIGFPFGVSYCFKIYCTQLKYLNVWCNLIFKFCIFQEFGNSNRNEGDDNDIEEVSDEVSSLSGPDSFSESDSNPAWNSTNDFKERKQDWVWNW